MAQVIRTVNDTLMSSFLYEGILFLIRSSGNFSSFNFPRAYKDLDDDKLDRIKVKLAGRNDQGAINQLGLSISNKASYGELLRELKRTSGMTSFNLNVTIRGNSIVVGSGQMMTAFQIFKADRFTGISCLELGSISSQLKLIFSREVLLTGLLGIYSSHVLSRGKEHYFLFFSPEEALNLLLSQDLKKLEKYFMVKEESSDEIGKAIERGFTTETIILELILSSKILELMMRENLDKLSLTLVKLSQEGRGTYKVYEQIPLNLLNRPYYLDLLEEYFSNPSEFSRTISRLLRPEDSVIMDAVRSMGTRGTYREADNALRALHGLYRFVTLGDVSGWYEFVREMVNSYSKLSGSNDRRERSRSMAYRRILTELGRIR